MLKGLLENKQRFLLNVHLSQETTLNISRKVRKALWPNMMTEYFPQNQGVLGVFEEKFLCRHQQK